MWKFKFQYFQNRDLNIKTFKHFVLTLQIIDNVLVLLQSEKPALINTNMIIKNTF